MFVPQIGVFLRVVLLFQNRVGDCCVLSLLLFVDRHVLGADVALVALVVVVWLCLVPVPLLLL